MTITITNSGLKKVNIDVFEDGVLRNDLSDSIRFGKKNPQEIVLQLDATGARYDVLFTPYGKRNASAEVVIREDTQ